MLTNNGMIKEGKDCFRRQKGSQECDVAIKGTKWKDSMNDKWHERKYEKGSAKKKREYVEKNTAKEMTREQMYRVMSLQGRTQGVKNIA